jgi:hypothetical protein
MKYIDGLTYRGRQRKNQKERAPKTEWHKWFAWYPVTVSVTSEQRQVKAWLICVMRKEQWNDWTCCHYCEYKEIDELKERYS